jgi:hypothetical protein
MIYCVCLSRLAWSLEGNERVWAHSSTATLSAQAENLLDIVGPSVVNEHLEIPGGAGWASESDEWARRFRRWE